MGYCINDEYEVYQDQFRPQGKASRNIARVRTPQDWESEAKMVMLDKGDLIGHGWRARCVAHHPEKVAVTLRANVPARTWAQAVARSLWLCTPKLAPELRPSYTVNVNARDRYEVSGGLASSLVCIPLIDRRHRDAIGKIVAILEHMAKFQRIEDLGLRKPDFVDGIHFSILIGDASNPNEESRVRHGDKLRFVFKNLSNRTLYFIVLNLTPLGRIHRLFPAYRDGRKSKSVETGDSTQFLPTMTIPSQFQRKTQPIKDVLKFFVSDDPDLCLDALKLPAIERYLETTMRGNLDLLECLRQLGADRCATLEEEPAPKEIKWGCENILVHTHPSEIQS